MGAGGAIKKYFVITLGALVYGAGISLFIDPNNLAPGGVSGLAIVINRLLPVETGTLILMINIPIMILGIWKFGMKFIVSTIYATFMISLSTNFFSLLPPLTGEPLLASLAGGVMSAVGIGLVMRAGATTGGTDILVKCMKRKRPYLKTGTIFLGTDSVIIGISGFVFGNIDVILYSAIAVAVTSRVLDLILYGRDEAKIIYIISNAYGVITERILKELDVGVTHLTGEGAYRKEEKQIIFCVVKKQNTYKVEEIVKQEDSNAFMVISSATEIYGEGYKSYFGEKL